MHVLSQPSRRINCFLAVALLVSLLFGLWVQLPRLVDRFQVEEDFRNLYWVRYFDDSSLFPGDPYLAGNLHQLNIGPYQISIARQSPAHGLLFDLADNFISPLLFGKLLIFPLLLASVYFIFGIGRRARGPGTGLALGLSFTVLNLASHSATSVTGGLQRSFTMPLFLGLLYFLMAGRYWLAAGFVFLSGVIYAPIFPVCAMTYGLSLLKWDEGRLHWPKIQWRRAVPLLIATVLVFASLAPALRQSVAHAQATVTNMVAEGEHRLSDPSLGVGGRSQFFHVFPIIGRGGFASGISDGIHMAFMALLALLIWLIRRRNVVPPPAVVRYLLQASVIGFMLSWLAFLLTSSFPLYLPSRYTQASFLLVLLFFIVLNAEDTLRVVGGRIARQRQKLVWLVAPVAGSALAFALLLPGRQALGRTPGIRAALVGLSLLLAFLTYLTLRRRTPVTEDPGRDVAQPGRSGRRTWILLGAGLLLASLFYIEAVERDFYDPSPEERQLYAFLETLPKDALIGGAPCILDGVPLYSGRKVLFSCDRIGGNRLVLAALRAYYAADAARVSSFCRDAGVDYLVVDESLYDETLIAQKRFFFEPFVSILQPELMATEEFALLQVAAGQRLFQSGQLFVVGCDSGTLAAR